MNLQKIKKIRKEKKITLKQMSTALGYETASAYFRLEAGTGKVSANQISIICNMLDLQLQDIFE